MHQTVGDSGGGGAESQRRTLTVFRGVTTTRQNDHHVLPLRPVQLATATIEIGKPEMDSVSKHVLPACRKTRRPSASPSR